MTKDFVRTVSIIEYGVEESLAIVCPFKRVIGIRNFIREKFRSIQVLDERGVFFISYSVVAVSK